MSILTPKMVLDRSARNPGSCVFFMPFNEGSGTTYNDVIGGVAVEDDNTGGWTANAHCAEAKVSAAVDSGSLPVIPAGKSLFILDVSLLGLGASALQQTSIGTTAGVGFSLSGGAGFNNGGDIVSALITAGVNTDKQIRAGTFNNADGVLTSYSAVNGAALAARNTADASAFKDKEVTFGDIFTLGSSLNDGYTYGLALYAFDTLPSAATILEAGDWAYDNWTNGIKGLPPQLASL